jgi:hypothetical protein
MNVNVPTQSRQTVFFQPGTPAGRVERPSQSSGIRAHDNLVNDDDFVQWSSNTDIERWKKLFLKMYY